MTKLILGLLVCLAVAACGPAETGVEVTEAQAGTSVTVPAGESLTVRLGSNRSTSYLWHIAELPGNLALTESTYEPESRDPGIAGGGGHDIFRFSARGPGRGTLRLEYRSGGGADAGRVSGEFRVEILTQ